MIALTIDVINLPRQTIIVTGSPLQEIEVKQDAVINVNQAPPYEGEYEVTPKIFKQTLQTAHKILKEDVCVKEIPYYEVSNNSGGSTVYIGNEV